MCTVILRYEPSFVAECKSVQSVAAVDTGNMAPLHADLVLQIEPPHYGCTGKLGQTCCEDPGLNPACAEI